MTASRACSRARAPALPSPASCGSSARSPALARPPWSSRPAPAAAGSGPQRPGRRAPDLRRVPRQGPVPAVRAVREGEPRRPAQRRRAAHLPELLAPRPAQLEALREVRQQRRVAAITEAGPVCQSCRPGPDLACSICGSASREQDRDLPGNRHPGLQPVPQAVGHLLPLRDRSTLKGGTLESRSAPAASTPTPPSGRGAPPAGRPGSYRRQNARAAAWTRS